MQPRWALALLVTASVAGFAIWQSQSPGDVEDERFRWISLRDLPAVSGDVLQAQGTVFEVAEPILYDTETGGAEFEVQVLSTAGFKTKRFTDLFSQVGLANQLLLGPMFGDETYIAFEGDARSLDNLLGEIRVVNDGANLTIAQLRGMWGGVKDLFVGLWELLSSPLQSMKDIRDGVAGLADYLRDTPGDQIARDVKEMVGAYLMDRACEVADRKSIQFLDMKTRRGQLFIGTEVAAELHGRVVFEVILFVVPFSKLAWADKAADAGKVAEVAAVLEKAGVESARAQRTARSIRLFPRLQQQVEALAKRPGGASRSSLIAGATNYRQTFFAKYPHLKGKVVVHHAIPQGVLKQYPGVMTEADIHALKNLRGIPKAKNADLHLSKIHKEWNKFYRENPPGTVDAKKLLDKAQEIDRKYGHLFNPPVTLK
jgi:hypothetical protein